MTFGLIELRAAAFAAQLLYQNGFSQIRFAETQYKDFGQEVKNLGNGLGELVGCATDLERQSQQGPPTTAPDISSLLEVCGDFKKTIEECEKLLAENETYGRERHLTAPLYNIRWNTGLKSEVARFSSRLASHNREISLVIEPLKLKLINDLGLSQQAAYRQTQANFLRLFAHLGIQNETQDGNSGDTAEADEAIVIPSQIELHLDDAFKTALPNLTDARQLPLALATHGISYHIDRSMGVSRLGDPVEDLSTIDKYLHAAKAIYILRKLRASQEFDLKVRQQQNLLWMKYLQDLEDRCKSQYRRYLVDQPEGSPFHPPSDRDIMRLYPNSFHLSFSDEQRVRTGITLGSNDEILLKTLRSYNDADEEKLAITRRSPLELDLRWTHVVRNVPSPEVITMSCPLNKALLIPIWAQTSRPEGWAVRFKGDPSLRDEGHFLFQHARDLHEFQQALLGYKVSYDAEGEDVLVRIYDRAANTRDQTFIGKAELWQDEELHPNIYATDSLGSVTAPSQNGTLSPSSRNRRQSGISSYRTNDSRISLPSTISSTRTGFSSSTYTTARTSPIQTQNTFSRKYHPPTEPMLVFLIRSDQERRETMYSLLAIKLDDKTNASTDLRTGFVTIERSSGTLDALRISFASDQGWNLATIGRYQQARSRANPTKTKVEYVQIGFGSSVEDRQERSTFITCFDTVKAVWRGKLDEIQEERKDFKSRKNGTRK